MKNISSFLVVPTTVLVSSLFLWLLRRYVHFKPLNGTNVLRQPRILLWLGIVLIIEFLAFQIWIVFFQFDQLPYAIFPAFFTLLGVSFVLFYFNWEIVVKPDGFVFRNSLRIKREYRFFDVTVEESSYRTCCELVVRKRSNDRRICAISDCFMDNYEAFGRAYRAYLKEKGITIKAKNSDTVRRSGALCVMIVLLCASLSGMLVWMTFSFKPRVWLRPSSPSLCPSSPFGGS